MLMVPTYLVNALGCVGPYLYITIHDKRVWGRHKPPKPWLKPAKPPKAGPKAHKIPFDAFGDWSTTHAKTDQPPGRFRNQCCHKYCDMLYQSFDDARKWEWRRAIKRSDWTPYDLWMSECLSMTLTGMAPPDEPSISGGYSTAKVQPGTEFQPAPCWGGPRLEWVYYRPKNYPHHTEYIPGEWVLDFHFTTPPPSEETESYINFVAAWRPQAELWRHEGTIDTHTRRYYTDQPVGSLPYVCWTYHVLWYGLHHKYHGALAGPDVWRWTCPNERPWNPPPEYPHPID